MSYAAAAAKIRADESNARSLMCEVDGCPNVWSSSSHIGVLCRAHGKAERSRWPEVTRQQIEAETEGAFQRSMQEAPPPAAALSREQKAELLRDLRQVFVTQAQRDHKAWAHDLAAKERAGEQLRPMQCRKWRAALGAPADASPEAKG